MSRVTSDIVRSLDHDLLREVFEIKQFGQNHISQLDATVWCFCWYVVLQCLVFGVWWWVFGVLVLVFGVWRLVFGALCLEVGVLCWCLLVGGGCLVSWC